MPFHGTWIQVLEQVLLPHQQPDQAGAASCVPAGGWWLSYQCHHPGAVLAGFGLKTLGTRTSFPPEGKGVPWHVRGWEMSIGNEKKGKKEVSKFTLSASYLE